MEKEVLEKMIADRGKSSRQREYDNAGNYAQAQCATSAPMGIGGCDTVMGTRALNPQEELVNNILNQRQEAARSSERAEKALAILREHPEFLDFIELIRTGCVPIY